MRISDWSSDVCSSDLTRKVAVYGIDVSGGDADGAWARARITLDDGLAYLARAAPAQSARVRKDIAPFLGHFSAPASRALSGQERTALRRSLVRVLNSEERRVGKECVGSCRYQGATDH